MAPNVVAAYHQHLFCARLDLALDDPQGGKGLVVSEVFHQPFLLQATLLSESPANPIGIGMLQSRKVQSNPDVSAALRMVHVSQVHVHMLFHYGASK